jgi:hypothetical protein
LKISTIEPHPTRDGVDVVTVPVPDPWGHPDEHRRQVEAADTEIATAAIMI